MPNLNEIERIRFPAGERHVKVSDDFIQKVKNCNGITANLKSSDDILDLMLVTDVLSYRMAKPENLYIPYLPYGRQDRNTTNSQPFSLNVFANLLNSLKYKFILTTEVHSDVTPALINNLVVQNADIYLQEFINTVTDTEDRILLAPDQGGSKRVDRFNEFLVKKGCLGFQEIGQALKHRNPQTGRVEVKFVSENVRNKNIIIYDDIIDGASSFISLAEFLIKNNYNFKSLSIFAAHGIFSKGIDVLAKYYKNIGTTNSFYNGNDPRVKVYQINYNL